MKQKDIALIILIVFFSGIASYFISNQFISSPKKDLDVSKVEPINAEFTEPNKSYFNDKSVNPTQLIQIDANNNKSPFRGE